MAHCAQNIAALLVTVLLSSYLVCQIASGIALKPPEGTYEMDTNPGLQHTSPGEGSKVWMENGEAIEVFPVSEPHLQLHFNNSRRKLGAFMSCSSCTCCDATRTTCLSVACCFTINCNIQPFGFCKFVPITCNCQGCGL